MAIIAVIIIPRARPIYKFLRHTLGVTQSVWTSLYERNERLKLQRENAEAGANAQRQQEEARRLRQHLDKERRRVVEAETSAR